MSKEFKGVWIPKAIYEDPELTPTDKLILSDIATLNEYFKSNETIGKEVGVSQRTASRSFKKLELLGYITTRLDGRNRVAKMARGVDKMASQPRQNGFAEEPKWLHSIQESIQPSIQSSKGVIYPFDENEFIEAWSVWILERKEKRLRKYTHLGEQTALHNLQKISNDNYLTAIQIINNSITHGWQGLFALKEQKTKRPKLDAQKAARWANDIS
tara:strand:- start:1691 stop:2332 length:642 start_codon:yes stop_codon:yes gene_type:complete